MKSLEKLFVNNNSILTLKNITLRDLRSLALLSLDRNSITEILNGDLHSLGESVRYEFALIYFILKSNAELLCTNGTAYLLEFMREP